MPVTLRFSLKFRFGNLATLSRTAPTEISWLPVCWRLNFPCFNQNKNIKKNSCYPYRFIHPDNVSIFYLDNFKSLSKVNLCVRCLDLTKIHKQKTWSRRKLKKKKMFKLESYITPILLSYVNRYINNFKPEDSQVY